MHTYFPCIYTTYIFGCMYEKRRKRIDSRTTACGIQSQGVFVFYVTHGATMQVMQNRNSHGTSSIFYSKQMLLGCKHVTGHGCTSGDLMVQHGPHKAFLGTCWRPCYAPSSAGCEPWRWVSREVGATVRITQAYHFLYFLHVCSKLKWHTTWIENYMWTRARKENGQDDKKLCILVERFLVGKLVKQEHEPGAKNEHQQRKAEKKGNFDIHLQVYSHACGAPSHVAWPPFGAPLGLRAPKFFNRLKASAQGAYHKRPFQFSWIWQT
jgi:hypothetical protein